MVFCKFVDAVEIDVWIVDRFQLVMQRLGLTEFIVGTGVVRAIALGQAHQFRQFGDKLFAAVELPKVEIRAGRGREGHLAHVRGRSVDVGDLPRRDIHAVDGVRIAGAEDVFHVQPCVLRRAADGLHEARFAAAGSALEYPEKHAALRRAEFIVDGDEAAAGVRAEKIMPHSHTHPSIS